MSNATIFVLGAGFTKAFFPEAPLLTDPYPLDGLLETYSADKFPHAHRILTLEIDRAKVVGRFDPERLMTRLDSSMPHDFELKAVQLLDQLRHDLYEDFVATLISVNREREIPSSLRTFARACIERNCHIITFNYDDFLDQRCGKSRAIMMSRALVNIGIRIVGMDSFALHRKRLFKEQWIQWGTVRRCFSSCMGLSTGE